ncbi:HTH-type transcriptional regulator ArgP [Burkholderia cenocepacia]|uniref:HTH-type transcriptional regulator ArgP n=1 Tax=Burkholderia cenocepacia TaxID=95486 RepID=UPI000F5AF705|nr:HTH-type transcriptional regulator ArgP [Burkholderia cenocepacia]RQU49447.1 ArgP/LysG family DNA-binding transcriptional regulator [Burkholderia cenocepacia]RQV33862.1 ArgP/LysG family DNA-binding transcriptional regulator [Burkholderia cenocepacia]
MDLDPKQTAAFQAVIETGSFEQAAVRLHITASAVTQRVRALETMLGAPLVLRTRPCRATALGQRVLQHLRRLLLLQADLYAELSTGHPPALSVIVALNSDSLGTWFLPALSSILVSDRLLFELIVDDQDHTFSLLESGMAVGCVTTEPAPMRGCFATSLGTMRYRLLASRAFALRWFPDGMSREGARFAPVIAYSRRDMLQSTFLLKQYGLPSGAYPCHYVPGTHAHFAAVRHGLGYGMVPELVVGKEALAEQDLIDLAPDQPLDVDLYWHAWKVQSPSMELLSTRVVGVAQRLLKSGGV